MAIAKIHALSLQCFECIRKTSMQPSARIACCALESMILAAHPTSGCTVNALQLQRFNERRTLRVGNLQEVIAALKFPSSLSLSFETHHSGNRALVPVGLLHCNRQNQDDASLRAQGAELLQCSPTCIYIQTTPTRRSISSGAEIA